MVVPLHSDWWEIPLGDLAESYLQHARAGNVADGRGRHNEAEESGDGESSERRGYGLAATRHLLPGHGHRHGNADGHHHPDERAVADPVSVSVLMKVTELRAEHDKSEAVDKSDHHRVRDQSHEPRDSQRAEEYLHGPRAEHAERHRRQATHVVRCGDVGQNRGSPDRDARDGPRASPDQRGADAHESAGPEPICGRRLRDEGEGHHIRDHRQRHGEPGYDILRRGPLREVRFESLHQQAHWGHLAAGLIV
mmetsp:Transcript_57415/g.159856  ORF Transcript_57415/g.159856 Transcript_57415/m.159856 type:complete len:251 (-) Transcript_57415:425-1177(-)